MLPSLVTGGVERGTIEMVAALVEAGWTAVVASAGGPLVHDVARAGGVHVTLPLASKNPFVIYANIARLERIIRRHRIDIIHVRSRAPAWSAVAAARRTRRHLVTTFHNAYGARSALKRYYNSVMARGERVITISNFVAAHVAQVYGVPADRLRLVPRGVDILRFDPERMSAERVIALSQQWQLPDGVPVVMLPGRLTRWKGHGVLIEALRLLDRNLHCVFLGSGSSRYREELEGLVARLPRTSTFQLVENCRDMPAAYMLADVVVSASTGPEGFGRVIVEAQAMARPVIATAHGAARQTVLPGETGWLVPPGDAAALAAAITRVLDLPLEERLALGRRAMAHVRSHYTAALMTTRTLAIYEELLFATPPRPLEPAGPVAA